MTEIEFRCAECGAELTAPEGLAGQIVPCVACKAELTVPTQAEASRLADLERRENALAQKERQLELRDHGAPTEQADNSRRRSTGCVLKAIGTVMLCLGIGSCLVGEGSTESPWSAWAMGLLLGGFLAVIFGRAQD